MPYQSSSLRNADFGKESNSTPQLPPYKQLNTTTNLYSTGKSAKQDVTSRQSSIHMTSAPTNFAMTAKESQGGFHSISRASSSYQNTLQKPAENNIIYESSIKSKHVS